MFKRWLCVTAWVAVLPCHAHAGPVRYDRHRVVRVFTTSQVEVDKAVALASRLWSERIGIGPIDIRVSPRQHDELLGSGLKFETLIPNVQDEIDRERAGIATGPEGAAGPFDTYFDNAQINAYVDSLIALRPDLAQLVIVGQTLQGRPIRAIRITGPGTGTKPGVLFHGCEHAREWISVPVCLYVADQFIRNYDSDLRVHELVDRCEFFIVPIFNVDGYIYSWTTDRDWRKNLRDNNGDNQVTSADGVDINRNWGYGWGGEGASTVPSNDTYRGPSAFSEPETRAMRDFLLAHPNIVTYNDLHSFSQLILWPWGFQTLPTADQATFDVMGTTMMELIRGVHGKFYRQGQIYTNIYPASGVSLDWAYHELGILGFCYELRDTGATGFLLPASQIRANAEEAYAALTYQADYATVPVRIELPDGVPAAIPANQASTMTVRVTDNLEQVVTGSVSLHWRTSPQDAFVTYPLVNANGNDYTAALPTTSCGGTPEFYFTAHGSGGTTANYPVGAPALHLTVPVGNEVVRLSDNFDTDQGWTVANTSVTGGAWVRVDPNPTSNSTGEPVQPGDDNPAGIGTMCYVTGQGSVGGSVSAADLDGGPTRLTSPLIDLSDLTNPVVSYYRWFFCSTTTSDLLTVEISNNNGQSWTTLESIPHSPGWSKVTFRVLDFVQPTAQMRIRFSASDNPANSNTEAAIDDVRVTDLQCQTPVTLGDMNCDNAQDGLDVAPFILALLDPAAYHTTYPDCDIERGDMNDDSLVNGDDIAAFVSGQDF